MSERMYNNPAENLKYLIETVVPFIEKIEEHDDGTGTCTTLNFDEYFFKPNYGPAAGRKISKKYDCGRQGCLAGWYVMMSEQDKRLTERQLAVLLNGFSENALSEHFGIEYRDAAALFGGIGDGEEQRFEPEDVDDYGEFQYSNEQMISARLELAESLLEAKK